MVQVFRHSLILLLYPFRGFLHQCDSKFTPTNSVGNYIVQLPTDFRGGLGGGGIKKGKGNEICGGFVRKRDDLFLKW